VRATVLIVHSNLDLRRGLSEALVAAVVADRIVEAAELDKAQVEIVRPDILLVQCDDDCSTLPGWLADIETLVRKDLAVIVLTARPSTQAEYEKFIDIRVSMVLCSDSALPMIAQVVDFEFANVIHRRKAVTRRRLEGLISSQNYVTSSRVESLKEAIFRAQREPEQGLTEALMIAHQIKGTAATMGFPAVGDIAGAIEATLKSTALGDDDWEYLWSMLAKASALSCPDSDGDPNHPNAPSCPESLAIRSGAVHIVKAPECSGKFQGINLRNQNCLAKVLLLDDDDVFNAYVQRIGVQRLVEVSTATDPKQAMELLRTNIFDGVIIDLNLGSGMDSYAVARDIRSQEPFSRLPLAFISASGGPEERLRAINAGAVLFMDKPLEPENFEAAIHQFLAIGRRYRSKVLLIEDDLDFAMLAIEMLIKQGFDVVHEGDGTEIFRLLDHEKPDLLLLDVQLPKFNGFEICTLLRANPLWQSLPVIFVTAELGWQARVAAFRCGADDYISKPLVEEELIAKVSARLERARLLEERTTRDTVTGVLVRAAFIQQLHGMFKRSRADGGAPASVVILDLDNFKRVNDLGGHLIGDSVLASLGRTLLNSFRPGDLRGRWGGDEFLIAFEDLKKEEAAKLVQEMLNAFAQIVFFGEHDQPFHITFSAGIAQYPKEGASAYELIKLADQRLYAAKAAGRRGVVIE
jgi:diguanylate cyclase (GGDEF)-like protein